MIRINKWLSEMGVCSKKQADRMILKGEVWVDDKPAVLGMKLFGHEQVSVCGQKIIERPKPLYLLYNKPVGVVCTHDIKVEKNLESALLLSTRVFAVGRLDKDSEGLLLLTNQGDIVNKLMRAENKHEKTYHVWVDKALSADFIGAMGAGVEILNTKTLSCAVRALDERCFEIVLVQGLNRQIRRMCQALGYRVQRLQRVQIADLHLADLPVGGYRSLSVFEEHSLLKSIQNSSNSPNS